uniref:Uncharacterized protein n=1 Tax=Florenciella sp. virus SA2 TaxID=3240092 RepID=A0AB39JCP2_9VIRU
MESKKININEHFLLYGKKAKNNTKKKVINEVKNSNIKELLLKKLKEYKQKKQQNKENNRNFTDNNNYSIQNKSYNNNEPLYGNLKNGKKPTFKQFKKKQTKKKITMQIEKKFNLGRNVTQKKIGVLIQKQDTRKNVENIKNELKNKNIKTIKNYLKTKNLIKYGSYAPNELIREIYKNTQLSGCNIENINKKSLLHNYINNN